MNDSEKNIAAASAENAELVKSLKRYEMPIRLNGKEVMRCCYSGRRRFGEGVVEKWEIHITDSVGGMILHEQTGAMRKYLSCGEMLDGFRYRGFSIKSLRRLKDSEWDYGDESGDLPSPDRPA